MGRQQHPQDTHAGVIWESGKVYTSWDTDSRGQEPRLPSSVPQADSSEVESIWLALGLNYVLQKDVEALTPVPVNVT